MAQANLILPRSWIGGGGSAALAGLSILLSAAPAAGETLTLNGVLTGADHQTYREIPIRVPAGVSAITVAFSYSGRDKKAVIDLGLRDPQRLRGWSGGAKTRFTLTETWATPSYLPGPLPPGTWKLILGVPNLRTGARADYTATITLDRSPTFHGFTETPLRGGPGWYRGDLHLHTGHSDGACVAQSGTKAPCPVFRTLDAAIARGLDFVAVTDHNTNAHFQALAELQPHYDRLLLIPGREVTTFQGHANVIGMTAPLDFQLRSRRAPTFSRILDQADAAGALVSINHPGLPSGEACMGCGWTATTDFARIGAVEVVNGAIASGALSGFGFWEAQLNAGHRITGVGGSDNHDARSVADRPSAVGRPATVVRASALSHDAILAALRAGHAFIDIEGTRDRILDVQAGSAGASAQMGDRMTVPPSAPVHVRVQVVGASGGRLAIRGPASRGMVSEAPLSPDDTRTFTLAAGAAGWLRADVTSPEGRPWLIGNPIYLIREQETPDAER